MWELRCVKQWEEGNAMCRADPGHAQPGLHSRAGPGAAHIRDCTALRWDWRCVYSVGPASHIQAAGRTLKHRQRHRARQGDVTVSEPWGASW